MSNNNERKETNLKQINRIYQMMADFFDLSKKLQNAETGMAILKEMLKLDPEYQSDNDAVLEPLHLYLMVLRLKVWLAIDRTVHNDEVSAYAEFFLTEKEAILSVFSKTHLQKVMQFLLLTHMRLHDLDGFEKLLRCYSDIFSYYYKTILYRRILEMPCGRLPYEEFITPLFRDFAAVMNVYQGTEPEIISITNMFVLSKTLRVGKSADAVEAYIKHSHPAFYGKLTPNILALYQALAAYRTQTDEVIAWCDSLDADKLTITRKRETDEIRKLCTQEGKIPRPVYESLPAAEINRPLQIITNHMTDRSFSRKELLPLVLETQQHYYELTKAGELSVPALAKQSRAHLHYLTLQDYVRNLRYWSLFEEAIAPAGRIKDAKRVVFFVNEWSLVNASVSLPILLAAIRNECLYVPTSARMAAVGTYQDPELDALAGTFVGGRDLRYLDRMMPDPTDVIDIKNRKILVQGMNVYQPVYEFVARYQFSYFLEYDTDAWARYWVHDLIRIYHNLFDYIREIDQWAKKNDKQVYFVSHAPHVHNASAFQIYCEQQDTGGRLNFVCVSAGYDNYFKNIGDAKTETVSSLNLTKHLYSRNSFLGTKEGFERYYRENRHLLPEMKKTAQAYLQMNRGSADVLPDDPAKRQMLLSIRKWKEEGKKILLLNGKVIFDLAVKYTKGCVHSDMSEWITHAVSYVKSRDDLVLLIKPHPHENREALTLTKNRVHTLKHIIRTELGENTIYLDNEMFRNAELTPYTDLGLVWNGTSGLEFAALGIKTLIGDEWGHLDYPIGFTRPKSLEEYERYLADPDQMEEIPDLSDRAVMFLNYMGSTDVRIENPYSSTTTLNFNQFDSVIHMDAVNRYYEQGDDALDRLFASVL